MAMHQVLLAPGRSLFFISEIGLDLTSLRPSGFVPDNAPEFILRMISNSLKSKDLIDVTGLLTKILAGEKIAEIQEVIEVKEEEIKEPRKSQRSQKII